jgi:hypothetical protein
VRLGARLLSGGIVLISRHLHYSIVTAISSRQPRIERPLYSTYWWPEEEGRKTATCGELEITLYPQVTFHPQERHGQPQLGRRSGDTPQRERQFATWQAREASPLSLFPLRLRSRSAFRRLAPPFHSGCQMYSWLAPKPFRSPRNGSRGNDPMVVSEARDDPPWP